jgi:hypothetical protein
MNYQLSYVPRGFLTVVVSQLLPYLPKSEQWSLGRSTVDDIVAYLYSGRMHLIAIYNADTQAMHGYIICEVKEYPQYKMLLMQYTAGEPGVLQHVEEQTHEFIDNFAKTLGCKGVEFVGRPGWKKTMLKHGYSADTIIYEKFFEGEPQ